MKNTAKQIKTAKVCLIVVAVTLILTVTGLILEFIRTGFLDASGCTAVCINCAVFAIEYEHHQKLLNRNASV